MYASPKLFKILIFVMIIMTSGMAVSGADPGAPYPPSTEVSDQRAGSVLFFNFYTSSPISQSENTQISITNTNSTVDVQLHMFFVNGSSGSSSTFSISLTRNQTVYFSTSDLDPGSSGYIIVVAVDNSGCPISFNYLRGNARVGLTAGHQASLGAIAFSALFSGVMPGCNGTSGTAELVFDGSSSGYSRVPRVVAVDKLRSALDNNSMLLVLNRFGGSLVTNAGTLGSTAGVLFNDTPDSFPFTFVSNSCQFKSLLTDGFPMTSQPFSTVIASDHTGWMKLYSVNDVGLLGAALNFNPNASITEKAFTGGHNLRHLEPSTSNILTIPIFPPY